MAKLSPGRRAVEATRDSRECIVAFLCAAPVFPSERIAFDRMAELGHREIQSGQRLVGSFYLEPSRAWARERLEAQRQFFEAAAREVGSADARVGRGKAVQPDR